MPFSHHSHSGQFCPSHARNTLEEMIQTAIARKMQVFALTEHIPREEQDFYPGEREAHTTVERLHELIDGFYEHAVQMRQKYADQIQILIGFEGEWIRPSTLTLIKELQARHNFDYFVGSVHHVYTIPIDYDKATYDEVKKLVGGSDEELFGEYFDAQYAMLQKLKPQVVGHFDLIRLFSADPNGSFKQWEDVWEKIIRNLKFIASYGGIVELNSSALRKGMSEPYPQVEICQEFLAMNGQFTLSDDSHGVEQVGLNYDRVLDAIRKAGIQQICFLERQGEEPRDGFGALPTAAISLSQLESHPFFSTAPAEA
ncbi:histidinol phosphatase [Rhizodiscina lignyota]|uniref:Histidinol-phosphatase n=1 Tax=Rhizodiscina lignyota TaxID=1504668 RepID=A0A9P4IB16_9PEZI|nr:histidinol phosphatase [Rhizodiscina lignyota]